MLLKASRLVLVRRFTPVDAASCNKNRVVLDRYESCCQMFSDSDGLLCTAAKGKAKNRLCMSPCCFKFYTEVNKKACCTYCTYCTYCTSHSVRNWGIVSSS
jgi:hypothetical protein